MQRTWRELTVGKPGIEHSVAKGLCGKKEERNVLVAREPDGTKPKDVSSQRCSIRSEG